MSSVRDPVCGMPVAESTSIVAELDGTRFRFCSEFCRQQFVRHPAAYNGQVHAPRRAVSWAERRIAYFTMEIALEEQIVPIFYERRAAWIRVMKQAIAINASFFNTHRMVRQYVDHAYAVDDGVANAG